MQGKAATLPLNHLGIKQKTEHRTLLSLCTYRNELHYLTYRVSQITHYHGVELMTGSKM